MSEREEESFKSVELEQNAADSSNADPEVLQSNPSAPSSTVTQSTETEEKTSPPASTTSTTTSTNAEQKWATAVNQFKLRRFFVLRPGTLDSAIEDIKSLVDQKVDGAVQSVWLLVEIDHWNNEKERVVLITEKSLLICKYDFIMLNCEQIQRIPLNLVDRITEGAFTFPPRSLLTREGDGVRVFWDKLREPSLTSRWNPFANDYPYTTLTYHPVRNVNEKLTKLCELQSFKEQLTAAAQKAHSLNPVPGKANGVLLLNQPILIEAYVGLMSTLGNQNKLGYCLARGNVGF
ncbi:tumor protein p63-regulated gene 1 protein [Ictalurus furcatus]|uniref:tumor protein p63-regulated gene 1 protein n=1 Tax=Ictalurus furcatus TaxID=66913 RepID=UPI002350C5F7|nr:tumor protein p63-regulated gene 1 protein [Ictalurus furcatus]XP_053492154.1 tumor protein p63-regulated gene 1 protein [Ictalurus furcatus]XP_053492155.1 tumor protein p63-regulated gene 1 protein [Ictalurus furcatus]